MLGVFAAALHLHEIRIIETRIGEDIKHYDRHIEELHCEKVIRSGEIYVETLISDDIKTPVVKNASKKSTKRKVSRKNKSTESNK